MGRRAVRFSPPRIEPTAEVAWVLRRAFGPPEESRREGAAADPPAAGDAVYDLAARVALSCRIGSRQPREALAAELGEAEAARFHRDRMAAAAVGLRLRALAAEVAEAAAERSLPLTFLKHMALEAHGYLSAGSRMAADVDVLAPSGRAAELHAALAARGFRSSALPAMEHQLPALAGPTGAVDVHRVMLGVRLPPRRRSATAEDLRAAGLAVPVPGFPGEALVPAPEVLAAHALVHGLAQHGLAPHAYAGFRLLADLIDLGFAGPRGEDLAERAGRLIERAVPRHEVAISRALCRDLAAGDLGALGADPRRSGEAALLHHLLAGALDPAYGRSLRFRDLARPLSDRSRLGGAIAAVGRALVPSHAELAALYGAGGGRPGRLGRRLRRLIDLVARAARYAGSALAVRRRRAKSGLAADP
jgi:hypothetical protein